MNIPLFDAHCDTAYNVWNYSISLRENGGHTDLERRCDYSPCAQIFAIFDEGEKVTEWCRDQLAYFKEQLAKNKEYVRLCRNTDEARAAFESGRTAAFLSIEGAELINCSEAELEWAYAEGVRSINITWNHENELSGSCAEGRKKGLTDKGRSFVRKCREMGILVDVSHISEKGFWDVHEIGGPMFASHSNAKYVWEHRRNLTDDQITAIVESNGAVGLNLYAEFLGHDPTIDTVIEHADYFLEMGAEHALCIGADFDGCDRLPVGIRGIEDMGKLYEAFLKKNYPEALVQDIFFNNLFSLFERTMKK